MKIFAVNTANTIINQFGFIALLFVLVYAQDTKQSLYLVLVFFLMMDLQIYYDLIVHVV